MPDRSGSWLGRAGAAIGAVLIFLAVVFASLNAAGDDNKKDNGKKDAETTQVMTKEEVNKASKSKPDKDRQVHFQDNESGRLVASGVPASDQKSPAKAVDFLLGKAGKDPRILTPYYNATFTDHDVELKNLYGGRYYTQYGSAAHERLDQRWRQAVEKGWVKVGVVPRVACNTFANSGTTAYQECGAISGNREGLIFKFPGKEPIYILFRCANMVTLTPMKEVPREPQPLPVKCPNGGATTSGREPCGTPWGGPDWQDPQRNPCCYTGPTEGYGGRGSLEDIRRQQPTDDNNYDPTDYGTNSGGGSGTAPGGGTQGPGGSTGGGTGGTGDVDRDTEGSGDTSGPGSDPGAP